MSGLVDRAVARGLMERPPSPDDARSVLVGLTPAEAELAARGTEEIAGLIAPLTDRLGAAERRRLTELLSKIAA